MREYKFRGKRIDGQGWIYGWLRQTGYQDIEKTNGQYIKTEKYYQIQDDKYNSQFVIEETIGQYTGLKDKNGKEIYENQILFDEKEQIVCMVFFNENYGQWYVEYSYDYTENAIKTEKLCDAWYKCVIEN